MRSYPLNGHHVEAAVTVQFAAVDKNSGIVGQIFAHGLQLAVTVRAYTRGIRIEHWHVAHGNMYMYICMYVAQYRMCYYSVD